MSGTNSGGMMLEIKHEGDCLYGQGRFYEAKIGSYQYEIQGMIKENIVKFFLLPFKNQSLKLGNIHASCNLLDPDNLNGRWKSSIGTEGVFSAKRKVVNNNVKDKPKENSVFIIHGYDEGTKEKVARFLEKLELNVIILHEQVNKGMTIIEKFEEYASKAGFAVALLTPDDIGYPLASEDQGQPRARQNVILEMGYFAGLIGRDKVCVLYKGSLELPSDIIGLAYHKIEDSDG